MEKNVKKCEKEGFCNCLSKIKQQQLIRQPILETQIGKSEDGKWVIHKTIITDIKPVGYFEKVLS